MAEFIPVDHDPFSGDPAKLVPVEHDPFASKKPGYAEDVAKAVPSGLAKGAASLIGLPAAIGDAYNAGMDAVLGFVADRAGLGPDWVAETRAAVAKGREHSAMRSLPTGQNVRAGIEHVTGKLYEPQTTPGKYAGSVAEFVPGAVAGPGGMARNLINYAVVPGIASEAAGQATEGTKFETPARIAGAVVGGGVAGIANRPRTAERALRDAISPNVDRAAVDRAGQLIDDAAARGVTLTWAEALEQAAPGAGLTNLQRVLESTQGSREILSPVFAQRPAQFEQAARQTFNTIAPPNAAPSAIGPAIGNAAEGTINEVRGAINRASEPLYTAAAPQRVDPQTFARVQAAPGWQEARNAVRNDPQLARYVQGLPDDSVGFLNEVKKYLGAAAENAAAPVNQQRNMQRSAGYGLDEAAVRQAAVDASPAYEQALNFQTAARERFLQPLLDGPLGKIAAKDTKTQTAINALFPNNPLPNSADEITTAVTALARRNQRATRDLVRAHAESTFNEAAANLQGGPNQFGGAKFAKVIAGNPQQRRNLEAAVTAMSPDGAQVWQGFNRFLDIVEATGTRQPIGSKTAFNSQALQDLMTGGTVGNAAKLGASPSKWLSKVSDVWGRWQLGRNVEQLAQILVDPQSRRLLRAIAERPAGNREASILAARLTSLAIPPVNDALSRPDDER